jgi:5-methylcytosine-specific restriction endonuclease McrA
MSTAKPPARRGTTNRNVRGNTRDREARRAYLLRVYESNEGPRTCRCYRCGDLLWDHTVTVDRIIPGARGGGYRRNNIRPSCAECASVTGGQLAAARRAKSRRL